MTPRFGNYHLRFFLVSSCNLRCVYCNPEAEAEEGKRISDAEIKDILSVGAEFGIRKVHYSGGEPTLRKRLAEIMAHAKAQGYEEQAITTNGLLLTERLPAYIEGGLTRVNISLDSLDPDLNQQLTGVDGLNKVRAAIDAALLHYQVVKLNMVVMRRNLHEVKDFIDLSDHYCGRLVVRFIELQSNQPVFFGDSMEEEFASIQEVRDRVAVPTAILPYSIGGENPNCKYFAIQGRKAIFGEIANRSRGYPCGGCRKIRISPYGDMGVCINAEGLNVRSSDLAHKRSAFAQLFRVRDQLDEAFPTRKHLSDAKGFWRWGDVSNGRSVIQILRRKEVA